MFKIIFKSKKDAELFSLYLLKNKVVEMCDVFYNVENIYMYRNKICKEKVFIILLNPYGSKSKVLKYLKFNFKDYYIYI